VKRKPLMSAPVGQVCLRAAGRGKMSRPDLRVIKGSYHRKSWATSGMSTLLAAQGLPGVFREWTGATLRRCCCCLTGGRLCSESNFERGAGTS